MRYTLSPKLHLSQLPLATRILLTSFLVSVIAALAVSCLKYSDRAEFTPTGAQRYWGGDPPRPGDEAEPLLAGEEAIDGKTPRALKKSTRQLVDLVHPHLFTVPIVLFILLHLLILTRVRDGWKIALIVHAFTAFAATFGLPFLIAATRGGALAFIVAGSNLLLSFAATCAILLFELWRPARGP